MRMPLDLSLQIETAISDAAAAKDDPTPRAIAIKVRDACRAAFDKLADEYALTYLAEQVRKKLGSLGGPRVQYELFGKEFDLPEFIAIGADDGKKSQVFRLLARCSPRVADRNVLMRDAGISADQAERERIHSFIQACRIGGCGEDEPIGAFLKRIRLKKKPARKAAAEKTEGAPA